MDRIADAFRRADAKMAEIDEKILGLSQGCRGESPTGRRLDGSSVDPPEQPCSPAAEAFANLLPQRRQIPPCTPDMWDTTDAELMQLMTYVRTSPHIATNIRYAKTAAELKFRINRESDHVNAFAHRGRDGESITILGGLIRMANLLSAAYVGNGEVVASGCRCGNLLEALIPDLGRYCLMCKSTLSPDQACRFAHRHRLHLVMVDPVFRRKAKSFAAGMLTVILAHEMGHLALGHCWGVAANLEVSRNREREADSFASSVISSSPFSDYLVIGSLLSESVWAWTQDETGVSATTHPLARERLADLIRANPSTAAELGLIAPAACVSK